MQYYSIALFGLAAPAIVLGCASAVDFGMCKGGRLGAWEQGVLILGIGIFPCWCPAFVPDIFMSWNDVEKT